MTHKSYFFITIIFIIIDQLSKNLINNNLALGEVIIIFDMLNITHLQNAGAAFSIGADYEISRYLLPLISFIASIFISFWIVKTSSKNTLKISALALILAGAVGNLIDRALFGYVIDFIDININFWGYHFAIFNLADTFITIGAILLILSKDD